ncbi:hypothetical protein CFP65_1546 [Kitasatospora sp. MMS16-BH015]|uniref:hypothetical protein n=1 Tax=Kitasatospora sp. MMS16-BH015 TaxID=2018025 RepID=UPI000CA36082|nr:hypothetical protein [Kitasatospora sp. MMS16-BH015]AUG76436.1 hypothetical protein CFP65_1546 [Kitasatospora sp. MMS16-BH015]
MSDEDKKTASGAPLTEAWSSALDDRGREAVARWDAARLETELRQTPALRGRVTEPVHSVRRLLSDWEDFVRRMESGWPPDGSFSISAYPNVLEDRDLLDEVVAALPEETGRPIGRLLDQLDALFEANTVPDPEGTLRPWVRPPAGRTPSERWNRRPRVTPW